MTTVIQAVPAPAGGAERTPQSVVLRVSITEVRRVKLDEVELRITLKNETNRDLYIPTRGTGASFDIQTLWVLHWDTDRGWLPLGPFSELPAEKAMRLHPGQSYMVMHRMYDPALTLRAGEGIPPHSSGEPVPLRGRHKVSLGFYGSAEEWQSHRKGVEDFAHSRTTTKSKKPSLPAQLRYVDSNEFDIPGAKP